MNDVVENLESPDRPHLVLSFTDGVLQETHFRYKGAAHRARNAAGGTRFSWARKQVKAFAAFLLQQSAWYYSDEVTAAEEFRQCIDSKCEFAPSSPRFEGPRGSVAATLAEALKAGRGGFLTAVLGEADVASLLFSYGTSPNASVSMRIPWFAPSDMTIELNGTRCEDADKLFKLAADIEASGDWSPRILAGLQHDNAIIKLDWPLTGYDECLRVIVRAVKESTEPQTLWASLGHGRFLHSILSSFSLTEDPPPIEKVVVRTIWGSLADGLMQFGVLPKRFKDTISNNLADAAAMRFNGRSIPIEHHPWTHIPKFHAVLYGSHLIGGPVMVNDDGHLTVDGTPMGVLDEQLHPERFKFYRDVLMS